MKQLWISCGRVAAASVVMLAWAAPMRATVVQTYSDRTAWSTSLTTVQTTDFNEAITGPFVAFGAQAYGSGGYTSGILNFLWMTDVLSSGVPTGAQNYSTKRYIDGGQTYLVGPSWTFSGSGDPRMVISFAAAANAFGIDIASNVPGISYQITVNGEATAPIVAGGIANPTFWGVRTDTSISQVVIRMVTSSGLPHVEDESRFDNAAWGAFVAGGGGGGGQEEQPPSSETPETSTSLYGATGLLLLAWTRYRRPLTR